MAGLFDTDQHGGSSAGGGGKKGLELSGKVAGIPVVVWVLVGVVAVWLYESKAAKAKSTAPATTSTAAAPGTTGTLTPAEYEQAYDANNPTAYLSTPWVPGGTGSQAPNSPEGTPTLSAINPQTGPASGGGTATITGTNFSGATGVDFGGQPAAFQIDNANAITVTIPPASAGATTVQITVVTGTGAITGLNFRYSQATAPQAPTAPTSPGPPAPAPSTPTPQLSTTSLGNQTFYVLGTFEPTGEYTGWNVSGGFPVFYTWTGNGTPTETPPPPGSAGVTLYTPTSTPTAAIGHHTKTYPSWSHGYT